MAGRVRVAALVLTLVLVGALAACGSDDENVAASGSTATTGGDQAGDAKPPAVVNTPPPGAPSVTGSISSLTRSDKTRECESTTSSPPDDSIVSSDDATAGCVGSTGGTTTFLVDDGVDPKGTKLAASVTVPPAATVLRAAGTAYLPATLADLADGAKVKVWFTGPVAESYPVQATAGTVVITS